MLDIDKELRSVESIDDIVKVLRMIVEENDEKNAGMDSVMEEFGEMKKRMRRIEKEVMKFTGELRTQMATQLINNFDDFSAKMKALLEAETEDIKSTLTTDLPTDDDED